MVEERENGERLKEQSHDLGCKGALSVACLCTCSQLVVAGAGYWFRSLPS